MVSKHKTILGKVIAAVLLGTFGVTATSLPIKATDLSPQGEQPASGNNIQLAHKSGEGEHSHEMLADLPDAVGKTVVDAAATKLGIDSSKLKVVQALQQEWSDSCLGLGGPAESCLQAITPGWLVVLADQEDNVYIYRTDETASAVRFDEATTQSVAESNVTNVGTGRSTTETVTETRTTRSRQTTQVSQQVQTSFTDVSSSFWSQQFIASLARKGIVKGFPDGKFKPKQAVTRAQFAAMVNKAFKKNKVKDFRSFRDLSRGFWGYGAITEAYEMGFLSASGNQFNPNQEMTRLDILLALTQGLGYSYNQATQTILSFYSDANTIPTQYRSVIAAATVNGLIVNYPNVNVLNLNQVATRSEVCALLYQALVSTKTEEYSLISSPYVIVVDEGGAVKPCNECGDMEMDDDDDGDSADQDDNDDNDDDDEDDNDSADQDDDNDEDKKSKKPNCNQGIGNGAEGCDPGNSSPRGGSNDEGGRTPGNR
ncbi:MAG: S-layer homology domain-containing protein [Spirulinaceae cyanobacterium]